MREYAPIRYIHSFLQIIEDFISVPHCIVCGRHLVGSNAKMKHLCIDCWYGAPFAVNKDEVYNQLITNFQGRQLFISGSFALFRLKENHDYLNLVHGLKYFGFRKLGRELGKELGNMIKQNSSVNYDFIMPVPIHKARIRERGFNQSQIIALGIADVLKIRVNNKDLLRHRYTITQTMLDKEDRKVNVSDVFSTKKGGIFFGKSILLVDDVLTTGSTINSAAKSLIQNGANRVDSATLILA